MEKGKANAAGHGTETPLDGSILIVEDDAAQAQLIRMTLEQNGFRCDHAPTGTDALAQLRSREPSLMLLDYSLPDMTGLDLVAELVTNSRPIPPFIMITCTEDTRLAVSTMRHGARDYILKDFEFLERLPTVVARAKRELETERRLKAAERALRESEARLTKAQQIARMGSWECDLATGATVCSEGMAQLLGVPAAELAHANLRDLARFLHAGDRETVQAAVEQAIRSGHVFTLDCRLIKADGSEITVNAQGEAELDPERNLRLLVGTVLDITKRKRAENEIQQLAYYDSLTKLPNRALLGDRLSQAIVQAHRDGRLVGVLFLDLDGFKTVNDTLGHLNGDRLLKKVSQRLVEVVRESDTVARIGGDEFVIVLTAINHEEDIGDIAGKILSTLAVPVQLDKSEVVTTASIGISIAPMDGEEVQTLLKNADLAMYNAKDLGKDNYRFFSQEMNIKIVERHNLDTRMRRALEQSEFVVHYQPQVDLRTGRLTGTEALIRWQGPDGVVPNDAFIPLAEETGLICKLGELVLRNACACTKSWQEAGLGMLRVSVNLSAREFRQRNLVPLVASVLAETGLEPQYLELEVTETTIMTNVEETERILCQLKETGVVISVDGFGTGYSSVHYLKRFALDRLKIDRSFLCGITASPADAAVTEAIIAMGHSLGLKVVAVGVEGRDQLKFLKARECDELQGYLISRPLPCDALAALLLTTGSRFELRGDRVVPVYREPEPETFDPSFST